ncbi:MAG: ABC-2 family transporter protein [Candidatus Aenigmatarchaeota archaeon]
MYKEIILTSFKEEIVYRTELIVSLIGSIMQLIVLWFLWNAIFNAYGSETLKGFTLPIMITYASISTILTFFNRTTIEYLIEENVKTGFISVILTKPISYPLLYLSREIGRIIFFFLSRGLPIILISFIFLNISMPANSLFFVSMVLGFFINFFLVFLTGLWAFWTSGSIWGIRFSRIIISEMLSGAIIPLYLFPDWLKTIAYFLPFQAIYSTPLLIYIGKLSGSDLFNAILIQFFWFAFLGLLTLFIWRKAEKKTVVQGG